jgi:hypothetical protein
MAASEPYDRHESDMAAIAADNGHSNPNIAEWERLKEMSG